MSRLLLLASICVWLHAGLVIAQRRPLGDKTEADEYFVYYMDQSHDAILAGRYEDAARAATVAIRLKPERHDGYFNRGMAYSSLGKPREVIQDITKAIERNGQWADSYNLRGAAYFELKDWRAALADYSQAIKLRPADPVYHLNRGNALVELRLYDGALLDFDRAMRLSDLGTDILMSRARLYVILKQYKNAMRDLDAAAATGSAEAYERRGLLRLQLGARKEALADFRSSIRIDPRRPLSLVNSGKLYLYEKDPANAVRMFTRALELPQSKKSECLLLRSLAHLCCNDSARFACDIVSGVVAACKESWWSSDP